MATAALSKINPCVDYMDSVVETIVVFVVVAILVAVADEPYSILRDTPTEKNHQISHPESSYSILHAYRFHPEFRSRLNIRLRGSTVLCCAVLPSPS
jgi:hypothetical protein